MSMIPRIRMTAFIAGLPGDVVTIYSYMQQLEHGEMPLPTFEGMIELLETANLESRRIMLHRVQPEANEQETIKVIAQKLFGIQMEVMKMATDCGTKFEITVIDRRPKGNTKKKGGVPNIPVTPPTLNPALR